MGPPDPCDIITIVKELGLLKWGAAGLIGAGVFWALISFLNHPPWGGGRRAE